MADLIRLPQFRFRARVLGFLALLLVGATAAGVLVQRSVLHQRLENEVTARLDQERAELENLAADGRDPATGEPFHGDVEGIFTTFMSRNLPEPGEAFLTYVDGEPHRRTAFPTGVDEFPEMYELWGDLTEGQRGEIDSSAGPVRYLAAIVGSEDGPRGVFVVVNFMDQERQRIDDDLRTQILVVGLVLLVALGIAWVTAGRLLRPVRDLTRAAQTISDTDLSQRIPVTTDDEVGQLARTFNEMLDRLEGAFADQRAFVDDAGHELRTPITVIMGQLELMGDTPQDRERTLAVVDDELGRMARIVEDLLLLAKSQQPDFVAPESVELSDYTTELLMKSRTLGDRRWVIDAVAEGTAEFDPQRVTQALLNLTRNAVEHSDGGAEIGIGSRLTADGVTFWVRDTGYGIPEAEMERLFDRFARGSRARSTPGGAGLGLAISKAVVEAHAGRIDVESEVGVGTRFEIHLSVPVTDATITAPGLAEDAPTTEHRLGSDPTRIHRPVPADDNSRTD